MKSMLTSADIRSKFLAFFEKRGHAILESASLVTPDEKGITNATLFNTAGMQPLVPFLLGKVHPKGTRLADVQKCVRTVDIDDIGDKTHATFFEMLGNWSLGDYFKKEAINWSYEFLTDKDEGLGLNPQQLYVTVFEGDDVAARDEEAADIWREIFQKNNIEGERIFYMPASMNWWEAGENGPCGPDTEMYYDISNKFNGAGLTREQFLAADSVRDVVEVWNDVFMQYEKKDGKIVGKLPKPSVDTGAGLERLSMTLQGVDNIYDTDLLKPVMDKIIEICKIKDNIKSQRIAADHVRTAVFIVADGVLPSNSDRGYVLRRLIRRSVLHLNGMHMDWGGIIKIVETVIEKYREIYENLESNKEHIRQVFSMEASQFRVALAAGLQEFNKLKDKNISGEQAFVLFSSYGFPVQMTIELAKERGMTVDIPGFEEEMIKHQELSRKGAEQKFKGGLADTSDMSVRYHTATHLLHQALFDVLGEGVGQKGSNITPERLRFDFSWNTKMTDEQKKKVEDIVNKKIEQALPMNNVILPREEAEKTGARHFFGEKYGEEISIYFVGETLESAYSKEFCGGPHVKNTSELAGPEGKWQFKIQKEEASSQGVRRIKAVLG
ncbi:MAG: alanine--tRNA ligase [bacterium]|nr:alanine--tRNA ligase [bacterium]